MHCAGAKKTCADSEIRTQLLSPRQSFKATPGVRHQGGEKKKVSGRANSRETGGTGGDPQVAVDGYAWRGIDCLPAPRRFRRSRQGHGFGHRHLAALAATEEGSIRAEGNAIELKLLLRNERQTGTRLAKNGPGFSSAENATHRGLYTLLFTVTYAARRLNLLERRIASENAVVSTRICTHVCGNNRFENPRGRRPRTCRRADFSPKRVRKRRVTSLRKSRLDETTFQVNPSEENLPSRKCR